MHISCHPKADALGHAICLLALSIVTKISDFDRSDLCLSPRKHKIQFLNCEQLSNVFDVT